MIKLIKSPGGLRKFHASAREASGMADRLQKPPARRPRLERSVRVRVSEEDRQLWRLLAEESGRPLSALVREAMGRVRPWTPAMRAARRERTRQIAGIGNNLNQIARWANAYKPGADAYEVVRHLIAVRDALERLDR